MCAYHFRSARTLTEKVQRASKKRKEESNLRVFILPCLYQEPIRKRGRAMSYITVADYNIAKIRVTETLFRSVL